MQPGKFPTAVCVIVVLVTIETGAACDGTSIFLVKFHLSLLWYFAIGAAETYNHNYLRNVYSE